MNIDIKIRWNRDICVPTWAPPEFHEGDVNTISVPCENVHCHADLLDAIESIVGEFDEDVDFEIIGEGDFWYKLNQMKSTENNKSDISEERIKKAKQILIDNGIEEDKAETVLQAIGYALLDVELFPTKS